MREGKGASIMDYFGTLEDPRIDRCKRRQLVGHHCHCHLRRRLLGLHRIVRQEQAGMQTFLELPHGIPSHDTFGDVFSRLDPEQFQQCCMAWTQAVSDLVPREVVSIDGKTVRRSHDRNAGKRAIHLVSAWASANTLTLGQVKTGEVGEVQRNHRDPPVAANAGTEGVHRHHRRHGLPAGDRPGDSGPGSRLRAGAAGEPGSTV